MNLFARLAGRRAGTSDAVELSALVRESVAADAAREVLHLRLGELAPAMRRPHHRRLLRDALEASLAAARTRIFDLPNGDLVAVSRVPAPDLQEAHAALLRSLDAASGSAVRRLRLPEEAARLLSATAESLGLEPVASAATAALPACQALGSADLAAAERALASADLEPVTLAQQVCRLDPESGAVETAWEDRRIAWPALAAAVLPGRDLAATPGLLRRLARLAEARMLAELARPAAQLGWRPIGLPLAPATVESPAFARFAEALPTGRRAEVVVALRPAELLADPAAALRMAPALRARGIRLALDDAAAGLLPLLPPERLGLDLLRLRWDTGLPAAAPPALLRLLEADPDSVVLTGVDRPAAIAWGWEAGIRLFQGPLVEKRRRGL
ncbi:EAL domain-containing protein [Falsiroseomonas sp.]|uniref:EAL domain-containing protein n=1 Tax=Falsiroseomonas sp. TaxID=2870721 RepID=UPI003562690A